ncbi:MAG: DUF3990 domain-containing protein [Solobacterium sp.]|nr:DUF3990 domain-containing protein [Solobacterium sp.]MDD7776935.1 DUF3990 domain-containing protein [Solobacterium sp.]MDY2952939.1 DUF3990 domain-containing protein [Erysipelotrichaceae bacterium]MDY5277186.1 DUF3990 domain-containing protein [Erysipelotrichaceae bacterium]
MDYNFDKDFKAIRDVLDISQKEFAKVLDTEQKTISNIESKDSYPSKTIVESAFTYAFKKDVKINKLKELLCRDNLSHNEKLLFHGSKGEIKGDIDVNFGRGNNDFGQGFYTGESYEQAVSFISIYDDPSVYFMSFDDSDLKCKRYSVDREWMMTIAYYRESLEEYENHPLIKKIIAESRDCDYIVAPIADNKMFETINEFIEGNLTDEQCKHCLAATNLGMQYVFLTEKAASRLKIVERCYVCDKEREYYKKIKEDYRKLGNDKVKLAKAQYRGIGKYIDEVLAC